MPSLRVLITGAAGYLGSILCERLLAAGYSVVALDNLMYGQQSLFHLCGNPSFEFVRADARDQEAICRAVKSADVLIPLAAIVGAPACDRDPGMATTTNLDAVRLLNRARDASQLVVYPTTNSGYGTKSGAFHCTEETPLEPITLYGRTKVDAEAELLNSPNVVTLRLATVFGMSPRMRLDLLVNHFVYTAMTDGYLVLFEKDFRRNFVHIRDVADCFVFCIENGRRLAGQAYNVGLSSANLSKEELALQIKAHVPRFYIHSSEVGSDPDKRDYIVSHEKLKAAGFEARRTLDEGIVELIKGFTMLPRSAFHNV